MQEGNSMTGRITAAAGSRAAVADELAREIKRRRTEAGMSQRVLAGRIGYSRSQTNSRPSTGAATNCSMS
ncbi:helix-turn-helix transcriptional regulator [Nocardia sp. NPDC050193]